MSTHAIILWAIPWFLATMLIEALIYRRSDRAKTRGRGYLGKDTACSLAMGLGNVGLEILFKIWAVGVLVWAYEHRVAELPRALWVWPLLILAEDHCYYWFHRIHHETRFFWAAHVNHHSSERY
ncbi:MAG: sterol desaturase family protein, partial [Myxococcales bacterium]|nr:sterol desaturase family protein [Myxococcales bacterium]